MKGKLDKDSIWIERTPSCRNQRLDSRQPASPDFGDRHFCFVILISYVSIGCALHVQFSVVLYPVDLKEAIPLRTYNYLLYYAVVTQDIKQLYYYNWLHSATCSAVTRPSSGQQGIMLIKVHSLVN